MKDRNEILGIIGGYFTALALSILVFSAFFYIGISLGGIFFLPVGAIGIFQVLYIIPYAMKLKRQGKLARMKGLIIGAVIVALINGACWLSFSSILDDFLIPSHR
jgi:hypothetical protein